MNKFSQSSNSMYTCECTNTYLTKEELPDHLNLSRIHKISKLINTSPPKFKYAKSALDQIQTITQSQVEIQKSSVSLIQTITKNTEMVLNNLSEIMRIFKELLRHQSNNKNIYRHNIKNIFMVKDSLNKEMVNHFSQRIFDKEQRSNKIIKKLKKQSFDIFQNHSFLFHCMAVSSDENFVAVGDRCGVIRIIDLIKNVQVFHLMKHKALVTSIALGKENNFMLSGSEDCSVRYWNLQSKKHIFNFKGHLNSVNFVLISEDNKFGYSCAWDKTVIIWNLLFLTKQNKIDLSDSAIIINLSKKRNFILTGDCKGCLKFINPINGKNLQTLKASDSNITNICISEDEKFFIAGDFHGNVSIYNFEKYSKIFTSKIDNDEIIAIDISPDSKMFLACSYTSLTVWDLDHLKSLFSFDYSFYKLKRVIFSKLSQKLIILKTDELRYKDLANFNEEIKVSSVFSWIKKIDISRDLKYMAYGKIDINLKDVQTGETIIINPNIFTNYLQFSSNSAYLANLNLFGKVNIYEVPSLIFIKDIFLKHSEILKIAISNDVNFVPYITTDNRIFIYCIENNSIVYQNTTCLVFDMAFCMNDERFIYLEQSAKIHILNKNFIKLGVIKFGNKIDFIIPFKDNKIVFFKNRLQKWSILDLETFKIIIQNKSKNDIRQFCKGKINEKCLITLKVPYKR